MAEENVENTESDVMDDWAAAMAEQSAAEATAEAEEEVPANKGSAGGSGKTMVIDEVWKMILDIPVTMTVELGRTKIAIRNLLQLAQGSVVELDGMAGEPMEILVNGTLIAQGEVVVVNDKFGIRLTDIISPEERLKRLRQM